MANFWRPWPWRCGPRTYPCDFGFRYWTYGVLLIHILCRILHWLVHRVDLWSENVKFDRISNSAFFVGANSTSYCDLTVLKAWTMIRKTFSLPGCSKVAIVEVFSRRILYTSESDKRSKKKTKCQNRIANNTPFLEDPFQSFVFFAGWCMFLASHS